MAELLTIEIANEYKERAGRLPDKGMQDTRERRKLRIELQNRCGLTELEAVNVIDGFHVKDYILKYERKAYKNDRRKEEVKDNQRMDGMG